MARQLAIIAISVGLGTYGKPVLVLSEAAATLAVLIVALVLHCRTQPYPYRSQNVLETVLASFSILAVVTASAYYAWRRRESQTAATAVSVDALGGSLLAMLLGPLAVFGVWASVSGRRGEAVQPSDMSEPLMRREDEGAGSAMPAAAGAASINSSCVPPQSQAASDDE